MKNMRLKCSNWEDDKDNDDIDWCVQKEALYCIFLLSIQCEYVWLDRLVKGNESITHLLINESCLTLKENTCLDASSFFFSTNNYLELFAGVVPYVPAIYIMHPHILSLSMDR